MFNFRNSNVRQSKACKEWKAIKGRFQDSVGGEVGLPLRGWLADLERLVGRCGAFHPIQGNASSMHLTQFKEMHLTPTENWHRHHLFFEIALGQKVWTPRYIFLSRSHWASSKHFKTVYLVTDNWASHTFCTTQQFFGYMWIDDFFMRFSGSLGFCPVWKSGKSLNLHNF